MLGEMLLPNRQRWLMALNNIQNVDSLCHIQLIIVEKWTLID